MLRRFNKSPWFAVALGAIVILFFGYLLHPYWVAVWYLKPHAGIKWDDNVDAIISVFNLAFSIVSFTAILAGLWFAYGQLKSSTDQVRATVRPSMKPKITWSALVDNIRTYFR